MRLSRRTLIGAALTGGSIAAIGLPVAWTGAGGRSAQPPSEAPRLLIDADAPRDFVDSTQATLQAIGFGETDSRTVDHADAATLVETLAWLTARDGRRVIGLLRNAEATLVQQLARNGSIRWLSLAQHGLGGFAAFDSRHRITGVPSNRGLARRLAIELAASGIDFAVDDHPLIAGSEITPRQAAGFASHRGDAGPVHLAGMSTAAGCQTLGQSLSAYTACARGAALGRSWETVMGEGLGLIAGGRWPEHPVEPAQLFAGRGTRGGAGTRALTSFVIAS
jgi:hypothetical protein